MFIIQGRLEGVNVCKECVCPWKPAEVWFTSKHGRLAARLQRERGWSHLGIRNMIQDFLIVETVPHLTKDAKHFLLWTTLLCKLISAQYYLTQRDQKKSGFHAMCFCRLSLHRTKTLKKTWSHATGLVIKPFCLQLHPPHRFPAKFAYVLLYSPFLFGKKLFSMQNKLVNNKHTFSNKTYLPQ